MAKIKLLYNSAEVCNVSLVICETYFDLINYEPGVRYNPLDTVLLVPRLNTDLWWQPFVDQGFKMVIDNVIEAPELIYVHWRPITDGCMLTHKSIPASAMVLQSPNYFRCVEALNWLQQGYDQYQPNRQLLYKALLLMNCKKDFRTQLVEKLGTQLDQCVWSYIEQGKQLNHTDISLHADWQRYLNPDWFDQCCFSIVAETLATPPVNRVPFVTEKTWKPVAMQHPFMMVGEPNTLQHLHSLGFETFENLWSENYDTIQSTLDRIDQVVENVIQYNMTSFDQLTLQKLKHNHNHFFNRDIIQQIVIDEIINPIFEYASK
jgi:hypothetical protein